jgi:hypothetical protein
MKMIIKSGTTVVDVHGKRYRRIFEQLDDDKQFIAWENIDDDGNVIESWDASEGAHSLPYNIGKGLEQTYQIVIKGGKTK